MQRKISNVMCALVVSGGVGAFVVSAPVFAEKTPEQIKRLQLTAGLGDSQSQLALAEAYALGYGGLIVSEEKAVEWLTQAALQGNTMAQYNLGDMYYFGFGVEKSATAAHEWYLAATAKRHPHAHYMLALLQAQGEMGPSDESLVRYWLKEGASYGDPSASYVLNQMGIDKLNRL
ncbi:sel1 repeat family protein [Photobacterium sp. BZF1]|uniref:tetratricopeptide repeat protein n=1 Tax=Photobacterium sp. BZF1 TaxID=1904457 RepID=UPI001653BBC5|nr:tetratricopeptide repeat protein [Photobacterium sp. BZF1]MBC7004561.1 sel1 repeat family protein [Photobacterium sp. BZF1]